MLPLWAEFSEHLVCDPHGIGCSHAVDLAFLSKPFHPNRLRVECSPGPVLQGLPKRTHRMIERPRCGEHRVSELTTTRLLNLAHLLRIATPITRRRRPQDAKAITFLVCAGNSFEPIGQPCPCPDSQISGLDLANGPSDTTIAQNYPPFFSFLSALNQISASLVVALAL